jgi:hypothetical protein
MLVSSQRRAPGRGRYGLRRAGRAFGSSHVVARCGLGRLRAHVGAGDVLPVAVRHRGYFYRNVDQLPANCLVR